jgi:hypothetical protein
VLDAMLALLARDVKAGARHQRKSS